MCSFVLKRLAIIAAILVFPAIAGAQSYGFHQFAVVSTTTPLESSVDGSICTVSDGKIACDQPNPEIQAGGIISVTGVSVSGALSASELYVNGVEVTAEGVFINTADGDLDMDDNSIINVAGLSATAISATQVSASYLSATDILADTVTATSLAGTLQTAAQTNITSLGTLTGLTLGGTLDMGDNHVINVNGLSATNISATQISATNISVTSLFVDGNDLANLAAMASDVTLTADTSFYVGSGVNSGNLPGTHNVGIGNNIFVPQDGATGVGDYNFAAGSSVLRSNTEAGTHNFAQGQAVLQENETGTYNFGQGGFVLNSNASGSYNFGQGFLILSGNTEGDGNFAQGYYSLNGNVSGDYNFASGYDTLRANTTGDNNFAHGNSTLRYTINGDNNIAIGYNASRGPTGGESPKTISNTIALGYQAGINQYNAEGNILLGRRAGDSITTGDYNIVIGHGEDVLSVTGSNQLNIGGAITGNMDTLNLGVGVSSPTAAWEVQGMVSSTGVSVTGALSATEIWINGQELTAEGSFVNTADGDLDMDDNSIINVAGLSATTISATQVSATNMSTTEIYIDGDGEVTGTWTQSSDRRLKDNIANLSSQIGNIMKLEPVGYNKIRTPEQKEFGFIAQDVREIYPELVHGEETEDSTLSLNYTGLIAPLIQVVQEQQEMIRVLEDKLRALEEKVESDSSQ